MNRIANCLKLSALMLCTNAVVIGAAAAEQEAAAPAKVTEPIKVAVAAQPIAAALNDLARQAGLHIVIGSEVANGVTSTPVDGIFTPEAALTRLLSNTGLRYEYLDARTIAVLSGSSPPSQTSTRETATPDLRLARNAAQQTTQQEAASSDEAARRSDPRVEEVVVTATKRAENIQDIPQSIAAITAQEIDRRGLVSAEDYMRGIPGVNHVTHTTGASIVIRGIETSPQSQNFSSGTTVATYFGETPTTNTAGLAGGTNVDLKLVDIERVEVLRGPQGTAFGNSSLGGAVRTIPVAPKLDRLEGKVGVGYSVTSGTGGDNHNVQGIGNIPLIKDKLAVRAIAYRFEDSGIYRNVAGSDPLFLTSVAGVYGAQAAAVNEDDIGASVFTGGRIAALFQPTENLKITATYATQETEVNGQAQAGGHFTGGIYDQAILQVSPEHVVRGQRGGVFDTNLDLANLTVEYDFGWANLLATASQVDSGGLYSVTATPPVPYSQIGDGNHSERTGEIRLNTQFDGPLNFLGGIYAEKLDDDARYNYYWNGNPAQNFFNGGTDRYIGDYWDTRTLEQKAAFAEATWKFASKWTLIGGIRKYDYERRSRVDTIGALFNPPATRNTLVSTIREADASGTSLRANLSYDITEDALVYAGFSQGFRLGKPQPGLPPGLCDLNNDGVVDGTNSTIASTRILESDEVDNYEIGTKLSLLNKRLTLSADVFRIDWTGVPFRVNAPPSPAGCALAYNANAGGARSEGIEFQASYYMTPAFRVDTGASWIDAALTEDAIALNAFADDRLPGSPKFNANLALQYEFQIGGHEAFVRADSIYVGTFYGDLQQNAITEAGGYLLVDASARVVIRNFNVDLLVRNITNNDDFVWRSIGNFNRGQFFGYRQRPRTIGLQIGYNF